MGKLRIDPWWFDPDANELVGHEQQVRLTPKASHTLLLLAEVPGRVLSRAELADRVGLSDEGLSRTINELRQALGDRARTPHFIETIPRRGYRLREQAASPAVVAPGSRRAWPWVAGLAAAAVAGIVVLGLGRSVAPQADLPLATQADLPADREATRLTSFTGAARWPVLYGRQVWFNAADSQGEVTHPGQRLTLASLKIEAGDWPAIVRHVHPGPQFRALMIQAEDGCQLQIHANTAAPGPINAALTPCRRAPGGLDWSKDGGVLAYENRRGGISVLDVATGITTVRTRPRPPAEDLTPRFHPDGVNVSFVRSDGRVGELMRTDPAGATPLTQDHQMVFGHAWIDQDQVILSSDRSGVRRLWRHHTGSGTWQDYGQTGVMNLDFEAPNLVFELPRYRADIWRWDGSQTALTVGSQYYDNHPRLSPDGRVLAFVSTRSGTTGLWLSEPDGSDASLRAGLSDGRITRPSWQDNRRLLYVVYSQRGSEVFAVSLFRGEPELMVPTDFAPSEVVADRAGTLHFLGSDGSNQGLLRWQDGTATLIREGIFNRLEQDQSGQLYLGVGGQAGVVRLEKDGALTPTVALPADRELDWTIGGNRIYFVSADGLEWRSLSGPERGVVDSPAPSTVGLALGASADGQVLYISRFHSLQVDLLHSTLSR
ncbi:MAG: winged helix-turn-helix domain-containing protein [Pseudomonadota bacterium]